MRLNITDIHCSALIQGRRTWSCLNLICPVFMTSMGGLTLSEEWKGSGEKERGKEEGKKLW